MAIRSLERHSGFERPGEIERPGRIRYVRGRSEFRFRDDSRRHARLADSPRFRGGRARRLSVLRSRACHSSDDSRADQRFAQRREHRSDLAHSTRSSTWTDRRRRHFAGFAGRGLLAGRGNRRSCLSRSGSGVDRDHASAPRPRDHQRVRLRRSRLTRNLNRNARRRRSPMTTLELYGHAVRRMRPHLGRLAIAIAGVLLASTAEVLKPWPLKIVIDNVLRGAPLVSSWIPPMPRAELLIAACISLVILYALLGLLSVMTNYVTISIGQRMVNELRASLFDHLQRLSLSFHRRREVGDLMVRITYDTYSIQTIAMNGFFPLLSSLILLGEMSVVMIKMDATLPLVALAIIPLLILLIMSVSGRIDAIAGGARIQESRLYTVAQSALAAIHVVQAFTREGESYREFVESSRASLDARLRLYTLQTLYAGAGGGVIACGTALVIYLGAQHVLDGRLTIGALIVFITYLASLYAPVNQIAQTYGQIQGAKAGLRRCLELLAIDPDIKDRAGAQALGRAQGEIEFDNVVFGYEPGRTVLKGISFKASPGEMIAIVGPSGSGKTTMASLLARFYEPQDGAIKIDGNDTRYLTLDSVRGNIAMVLQPPLVLGDTMRVNVAFGKPGVATPKVLRAIGMPLPG